jgi:hypothetical protein
MLRRRALIGTAGALATAALLAGGGAASATASDVIVSDPFAATSGDECRMGSTAGKLGWHLTGLRQVDVRGAVVDRGANSDPGLPCGDDRRYPTATFTAYSGGVAVRPSVVQRVDNGTLTFSFPITAARAIDLVVVQVCRHPLSPGPATYCGPRNAHRAPVSGQPNSLEVR